MRSKLIVLLFGFFTVGVFAIDHFQTRPNQSISVPMFDAENNKVGVIVLQPIPNERVLITVNMIDMSLGFHGFHIHETGLCEVTDEGNFLSAGGHFDLSHSHHGDHSGDLPSLEAAESGRAFLAVHTDRFHFEDLFDDDGSTFIVHVGADNFANIPARYGGADETTLANGDAGGRFACGVIAPPK